jgi:hypothetical protein
MDSGLVLRPTARSFLKWLSKKRFGIETFFSTTTYAALPYFGTLLWETV